MAVPLFNRALVDRAESARATAHTELAMVLRQLTARVESAYAQYQATRYRQDAQENDVLPATREAAALSFEAYQSGGLDLTGTLAVEQALSDAELTAARLTATRALAWATLAHAVGGTL